MLVEAADTTRSSLSGEVQEQHQASKRVAAVGLRRSVGAAEAWIGCTIRVIACLAFGESGSGRKLAEGRPEGTYPFWV